jgi:hypothetical protein
VRQPLRWPLGVAAALTLAAPGARADGSGDHKAAAQVLFERAQALVEQNRYVEACPQFAESERLDPGIGSLLWLADCYENIGLTANAWTTFEEAAVMAASRHDAREAIARDRAARLGARLSQLRIVVPPAVADTPGLQVHCDGVRIESPLWSQAISLDPGTHTVTANADDRQVWWTTVQLAPGASATSVTVPELGALPPPVSTPRAPGADVTARIDRGPGSRGTSQRVAGAVLAAGGVVGLVVGAVFSLNARAKYDDSKPFCLPDNECTATGMQDRSDADSKATVATLSMALGAAAVAGGVALYLTAPRAAPVTVALAPGARSGSLRVNWSW